MHKPDFIICGTQKGGTGSLYRYLQPHPEIYMPTKKEIHFFDKNLEKGHEWYKQHFEKSDKGIITGEATPEYMYLEEVPKIIHENFPDVKLIFILRNPIERAHSHYWHNVKNGREHLSFEDAIEKEEDRVKDDRNNRVNYAYKSRGKYVEQLKRFETRFGWNQMLILFSEDLEHQTSTVMRQAFNFLDVDDQFSHLRFNEKFHTGGIPRSYKLQNLKSKTKNNYMKYIIDKVNLKNYPPIDPKVKEKLTDYFRPYNKELEMYLNKKIDWDLNHEN